MVGEAGQRHAVARHVQQPAAEIAPVRHQERRVIEAGGIGRGEHRARRAAEQQERPAAGAELHPVRAALDHLQAEEILVERLHGLEIAHHQRHHADRQRPRQREAGADTDGARTQLSLDARGRLGGGGQRRQAGERQHAAAGEIDGGNGHEGLLGRTAAFDDRRIPHTAL